MSLEDIFEPQSEQSVEEKVETTDQVVEEVEATAETDSETTSQEPEAKDDAGDKPEEPKAKESEEDIEKQEWTLAAVKDERRKRQELERKLEELQKQQGEKQEELPDVFDDQKAFVDSIRQEYRQELAKTKLELAREMMMDSHDDYEAMETLFIETIAKENPVLAAEARKASNPAKFVYQNAKKYQEYKEMQDVDSMREKLRAEIRAELKAELDSAKQEKAAKVSDIKPSLAKARASDKDTFEPESIDTLFGS